MNAHGRILAAQARPASLSSAAAASSDYGAGDSPDWRSVYWPAQLHAMTVEGRRIHLADLGSAGGTPILMIHGLGGRWQNWLENMPRLAEHRRVVAVDLPGFGRSQMPTQSISIGGYARALDRVCDLLELDAAIVAGSSLGGLVAAELALRFPQRTSALVLVAAACLAPTELSLRGAQLALAATRWIAASLPQGASSTLTRARARHLAFATVLRHPTRIATDTLYELVSGARPPGTFQALAALSAHDIAAELPELAVPTLVVHGHDDMLIPYAEGERLAALIPGAELRSFADTGHMPMLERPVPFNDALLEFIDAL